MGWVREVSEGAGYGGFLPSPPPIPEEASPTSSMGMSKTTEVMIGENQVIWLTGQWNHERHMETEGWEDGVFGCQVLMAIKKFFPLIRLLIGNEDFWVIMSMLWFSKFSFEYIGQGKRLEC